MTHGDVTWRAVSTSSCAGENKRYAARHGVPFVDCDYDQQSWFDRMKGYEYDPERGARCTACFDMRMEVGACGHPHMATRYYPYHTPCSAPVLAAASTTQFTGARLDAASTMRTTRGAGDRCVRRRARLRVGPTRYCPPRHPHAF